MTDCSICYDENCNIDDREVPSVKTSFELPFIKEGSIDGEKNYDSYKLHCLRTKLYPYLKQEFPHAIGIGIEFSPIYVEQKMTEFLTLVNGYKLIDKSKLTSEKVNRIKDYIGGTISTYPQHSLILDPKTITHLPYDWVISVGYIFMDLLDSSYEPVWLNDTLLVRLDTQSTDYKTEEIQLLKDIKTQLEEWWKLGAIINAESIVKSWDLKLAYDDTEFLTSPKLWIPKWKNKRLTTNPVTFLRQRLNNPDSYIFVNIQSNNTVVRHLITENLLVKYVISFYNKKVGFKANNYKEACRITFIIDEVLTMTKTMTSSTFILSFEDIDKIEVFKQAIINLNFSPVVYMDEIRQKYVLSTLVPLQTDLDTMKTLVYQKVRSEIEGS